MKKHWLYLKYVIRHKWFVFHACRRCGVGLWQSLIHDWHKFLPSEWFPYANYFYGKHFKWSEVHGDVRNHLSYEDSQEACEFSFEHAWNAHQKRGKHHWQYWVLTNDSSLPKFQCLLMPDKYVREMVADWWGAGKAITGNWDAVSWYNKNRDNILIHDATRSKVEDLLQIGFETPEVLEKRKRILGF